MQSAACPAQSPAAGLLYYSVRHSSPPKESAQVHLQFPQILENHLVLLRSHLSASGGTSGIFLPEALSAPDNAFSAQALFLHRSRPRTIKSAHHMLPRIFPAAGLYGTDKPAHKPTLLNIPVLLILPEYGSALYMEDPKLLSSYISRQTLGYHAAQYRQIHHNTPVLLQNFWSLSQFLPDDK